MQKIGVFCSSYEDIDYHFIYDALVLADWIGNKELVFGGTNKGMMRIIASRVKENGGKVTGIIPQNILDMGLAFPMLDNIIVTTSLSERKDLLIANSDIIIAMPGGFGTLDEAFTTIAQRKLGYHDKELIFCNTNGIFDEMIACLDKLYSTNLAPTSYKDYYKVFDSARDCADYLQKLLERSR